MLTIRLPEPLDRYVRTAAIADGSTSTALVQRAVERELDRMAARDVAGRSLRAVGWGRAKSAAPDSEGGAL